MATDFAPIRLAEETDFCIGGLRVRPALRVVQPEAGCEQTIEPRVMQLLVTLATNEGSVVSREQLIGTCWDGRVVSDDAINSCVAKARRIGDAHQAFSIETIPRVGYRLSKNEATASRTVTAKPWRPGPFVALSAGLVAVVGAWWLIASAPYGNVPSHFAVMPVTAIDGNPATRAIAAELTEQVAAALNDNYLQAAIPIAPYVNDDAKRRASHAIRLSAFVDGGMLHVLASIEDLSGGGMLWSREFARSSSEVHSLGREVAARTADVADMVASLWLEGLDSSDAETLAMVIDSYDRYFATDQRHIEDIVALLERVTEKSPDFARGYAMYGSMLLASSLNLPAPEFLAAQEKARNALEHAYRIDPKDPPVYVGLAALTQGTEWSKREAIFQQGMTNAADNANSSLVFGRFLLTAGFLEDGLKKQRRALGSDRFGQGPTWWIASSQYLNGQTDKALDWLDDFLEIQPDHVNARRARFMITALERPPKDTRALLADPRRRPLDYDDTLEEIFDAYLTARETGTQSDVRVAVDTILTHWPDYIPGSGGILLTSRLGDLDAAFALATDYASDPRTTRESYHFMPMFLFGPATEAMRRDARFITLMEQLGLLDYWRKNDKWPDFCEREPRSICSRMKSMPRG